MEGTEGRGGSAKGKAEIYAEHMACLIFGSLYLYAIAMKKFRAGRKLFKAVWRPFFKRACDCACDCACEWEGEVSRECVYATSRVRRACAAPGTNESARWANPVCGLALLFENIFRGDDDFYDDTEEMRMTMEICARGWYIVC